MGNHSIYFKYERTWVIYLHSEKKTIFSLLESKELWLFYMLSGFYFYLGFFCVFMIINVGARTCMHASCCDGLLLHICMVWCPVTRLCHMEPRQTKQKQSLRSSLSLGFTPSESAWNIRKPLRIGLLRTKGVLLDSTYMGVRPLWVFHHHTLR